MKRLVVFALAGLCVLGLTTHGLAQGLKERSLSDAPTEPAPAPPAQVTPAQTPTQPAGQPVAAHPSAAVQPAAQPPAVQPPAYSHFPGTAATAAPVSGVPYPETVMWNVDVAARTGNSMSHRPCAWPFGASSAVAGSENGNYFDEHPKPGGNRDLFSGRCWNPVGGPLAKAFFGVPGGGGTGVGPTFPKKPAHPPTPTAGSTAAPLLNQASLAKLAANEGCPPPLAPNRA